jgi:membrane protein YdbS with pleckstrin-like domain
LILGLGFVLSLLIDLAVPKFTGQVWPLTCLFPITLVLLVSLLASLVVYVVRRELTTIVACIVLVLASLAYLALIWNGIGFVFAY